MADKPRFPNLEAMVRDGKFYGFEESRAELREVLALVPDESNVWDECKAERERAHAKHGVTSMESAPPDALIRYTILVEEVGEVARAFNEGHHNPPIDFAHLREELIQVAAMAGAWADAIPKT